MMLMTSSFDRTTLARRCTWWRRCERESESERESCNTTTASHRSPYVCRVCVCVCGICVCGHQGRVVVLQQTTPISEPRELCRLDEGAYFGEVRAAAAAAVATLAVALLLTLVVRVYMHTYTQMALLTDRPRTATVAAAAPETRLLALDRTVFRRLLGPFSKVLRRDKALYNAFMAQKI